MSGVKKLARERAKKASLHNKKLRDCRIHYNDLKKRKDMKQLFLLLREIQHLDQLQRLEI